MKDDDAAYVMRWSVVWHKHHCIVQGSRLRYLDHPDRPLETVIMGVIMGLCLLPCLFLNYLFLLSCLFLNLELTLILACN